MDLLPRGYAARPARLDDAAAIAGLLAEVDRAEGAPPWATPEDVAEDFRRPRMDPEGNARCVERDGGLVAYAEVWPRKDDNSQIDLFSVVHPGHRGVGVGYACLNFCEGRSRELAASPLLFNWTSRADDGGVRLLEREGYEHVRTIWHMEKVVTEVPEAPHPPNSFVIRTLDPERDARDLHAVMEESFSEHWGWTATPFEDWWAPFVQRPDFDPGLTLVAHEGDRMVAGCINGIATDRGWVRDLGVLEPSRGRGLAQNLLLRTFRLFADRGFEKVGLGVDSENTTNATRLYERVGMSVYREFLAYSKTLG